MRGRGILAEFLGTFLLVFAGTGAIVVDGMTGGRVTGLGIALAFGLVVMIAIFLFREISGAHLNPAVTLGLAASRRVPWSLVPEYVGAQCAGAVAASCVLRVLFAGSATLGATLPIGAESQAFALETLLTFFLMLVVLAVSSETRPSLSAPLAVGGVVFLDALVGGPISGASMNPARSLGPAIVSGHYEHLWIYFAAPVLGAVVAAAAGEVLFRDQRTTTTRDVQDSAPVVTLTK